MIWYDRAMMRLKEEGEQRVPRRGLWFAVLLICNMPCSIPNVIIAIMNK
jgi:hypothetical protein